MSKFIACMILFCVVFSHAVAAPVDDLADARALQAEMMRLRGKDVPLALEKGRAALALLDRSPDDRLKLSLLSDVALLHFQHGNKAMALKIVEQGLALAKQQHNAASLRSFRIMQIAWRVQGNGTEAVRDALAVLKEARLAADTPVIIDAMTALAQAEMKSGNFEQSMKYLVDALAYADQAQSLDRRLVLLTAMSVYYTHTKDWQKSLAVNLDAEALAARTGDDYSRATLMMNRSIIYSALDRPEQETAALVEAEALGRSTGNNFVLMGAAINLSDTLLQRKDYKGSLEMADRGLAVAKSVGDEVLTSVALLNRGAALNRLGDHARGIASMREAIELMHRTGASVAEAGSLEELSSEYLVVNDYPNALKYYKQFKELSDKLRDESSGKTAQRLEARYESEKQEKRIATLVAENEKRALVRNFSVIGALLGLALAAAVLARYRLLKRTSGELETLNNKLQSQAVTDPLTGLHNRRFFLENVNRYIASSDRAHHPSRDTTGAGTNKDLVFFMIDIDHFKHVNDSYGHAAGDAVLTQAVDRLRASIRDIDELVRWGGEEFLLIATQTSQQQASEMAERLRAAVAATPFEMGEGRVLSRTCSIGFAAYPLFADSPKQPGWEQIVNLADQALYVAKESGRDGWVGVLGKQAGPATTPEPGAVADLHRLITGSHCDLTCSFKSTADLVWQDGVRQENMVMI